MGVQTFPLVDVTSPIAPARLLKALCIDSHNCVPKIVPQFIKSIDILEGEPGSIGCVRQVNFHQGGPSEYMKSRFDEVDIDKCYVKYTIFEGEDLNGKVEYFVHEVKIQPLGNGSHYKLTCHYHTKGDAIVTEEEMKFTQAAIVMTLKAAEKYLLENPELYA